MTPIARYNIITAIIPTIIIIALLVLTQYVTSGSSDVFEWSSINPLNMLYGFVFFLSFGFGIPVAASWTIVIAIILIVLFLLYYFVRQAYK